MLRLTKFKIIRTNVSSLPLFFFCLLLLDVSICLLVSRPLSFFSGICDFGSATFTYDMRRLQEIMDFPKCWHKRGLFSRLFLGKEGTYATKSGAAAQAGDVTDGVYKVQSA